MKLVFFEGIAGSGKTTTAEHVGAYLSNQNVSNRLLKEIDEDNPFVIQAAITDGDEYIENSKKEWDQFIATRINNYPVWLFDGALLQCTTNALVFLDYPRDLIQEHIFSICEKLKPYNPRRVFSKSHFQTGEKSCSIRRWIVVRFAGHYPMKTRRCERRIKPCAT